MVYGIIIFQVVIYRTACTAHQLFLCQPKTTPLWYPTSRRGGVSRLCPNLRYHGIIFPLTFRRAALAFTSFKKKCHTMVYFPSAPGRQAMIPRFEVRYICIRSLRVSTYIGTIASTQVRGLMNSFWTHISTSLLYYQPSFVDSSFISTDSTSFKYTIRNTALGLHLPFFSN